MINRLNEWLKKSPIARNTAPKLASLLFAVLLWIYVMDVENPEMLRVIKNVDITIVGEERIEGQNLVVLEGSLPLIDVTVKGRRTDVNNIDRSDITLTADIGVLEQGKHTVTLERSVNVEAVTITALSQRSVEITLDRLVEELKPVEIAFKGEGKPGFLTEAAAADPPMILVRGPETLIRQVARLQGVVESASVTAMTEAQIPVHPVDSAGKRIEGVTPATRSVKAMLSLFQVKTLTVNPTLTGRVPEGFELVDVQLNPSTVSLKGTEDLLKDFIFLKTKPINLSALTQTATVNAELDLPAGIAAVDLNAPLKALIRIEAIKVRELNYGSEEVQFINVAPGTAGRLLGPVKIRIRGIGSLVDAVRKEDIKLRIDLAEQGPGRVNANLLYDVSAKYSSLQLDPSRVEIDIAEQ